MAVTQNITDDFQWRTQLNLASGLAMAQDMASEGTTGDTDLARIPG